MITAQDISSGLDFTGIPSAGGADLNNGIQLSVPTSYTDESTGRGFSIVTTDTALNVPDVPNPTVDASYLKFKRYQWIRRPFAGSTEKGCLHYDWNDDAPNDATYLKWIEQFVDNTAIEATANNALASATNAVTIATNAGTTAAAAVTTANNANTLATTANNTANTAQTTANTGVTNAATAQATANDAQTNALNALARNPTQKNYIKLTETQVKGTDAGGAAAGKNTRQLNTTDYNGANVTVALAAGVVIVSLAGWYWIDAFATMYDNSDNQHQLLVVNNTDNTTLLTGNSMYFVAGGAGSQVARVCGLLYLNANQAIRLDHYISNAQATNGLGRAANVHPDAGGKEVYAGIEMIYQSAN